MKSTPSRRKRFAPIVGASFGLLAILTGACATAFGDSVATTSGTVALRSAAVAETTALTASTTGLTAVPSIGTITAQQVAQQSVPTASELAGAVAIKLGSSISVEGTGATVSGQTVTITEGGAYRLTGTLTDGQVIVAAGDQKVQLVLDGANVTSSTGAAIYIQGGKTDIVLAEGSTNHLADSATRRTGEEGINGALYSDVDLTIGGSGSLTVTASFNDGIASSDDLDIVGGTINVVAVGDGLRGKDRLVVDAGSISVEAGADGLKASNAEDPEKGFLLVRGGTVSVRAQQDGLQAETDLVISGGDVTIVAGGGSGSPTTAADESAKALKAVRALTIEGGTLTLDSRDDGIHSDGTVLVRDGVVTIRTGDDGIHADTAIQITGGSVTISESYEGIESPSITLDDGTVRVTSRDDGLNAAGGEGETAMPMGRGQAPTSAAASYTLRINGGYLYVDSAGDGLDANGTIEMTGGVVVVNGPTVSVNGAIDYDRDFILTGGTLVTAGSAGMAQAPGTSSTQPSVLVVLPGAQTAGTLVRIASASGEEIVTFAPTKSYQAVVVSTAALKLGETYTVSTGGSSTGVATDGLYVGGQYSGGTEAARFTTSAAVTRVGSASATGPGGGRGFRP